MTGPWKSGWIAAVALTVVFAIVGLVILDLDGPGESPLEEEDRAATRPAPCRENGCFLMDPAPLRCGFWWNDDIRVIPPAGYGVVASWRSRGDHRIVEGVDAIRLVRVLRRETLVRVRVQLADGTPALGAEVIRVRLGDRWHSEREYRADRTDSSGETVIFDLPGVAGESVAVVEGPSARSNRAGRSCCGSRDLPGEDLECS